MAINKIKVNGEVKIDLTNDTAVPADIRKGKTFHGADGEIIEGSLDLSVTTAAANDVREGKVFVNENGEQVEGTLTFDYTLKDFINGVEVLSVADDTVLTDWQDITELPDYFCVGGCDGKLQTVRFDNVDTIGSFAFAQAANLENAIFPSCKEIHQGAFSYHTNNSAHGSNEIIQVPLTGEVYFPNVEKLGYGSFIGAEFESISLPKVKGACSSDSMHDMETNDTTCTFMSCTNLKNVDMPLLECLGAGGFFDGCSNLEEIHLPEVIEAGFDMCWDCTNLKVVDMPKCESILPTPFKNCPNLTTLNLSSLRAVPPHFLSYSPLVEEINLPECTELMYFSQFGNTCQNYFLPYAYTEGNYDYQNPPTANVRKILLPKLNIDFSASERSSFPLLFGSGPSAWAPQLEEVNLDSLEYLARSEDDLGYIQTFDCLPIRKISLNSCKAIHNSAFCYTNLEEITLPACKVIGNYVFNGSPIKKADLSVIENMYASFASCSNLQSVIIRTPDKVCNLNATDAFEGHHPMIFNIYVPDNLVDSYKVAENWVQYATYIKPLSSYQGGEI